MTDYRSPATTAGRRRPWLAALLIPLFAFLIGLAAMGWLLARSERVASLIGVGPGPAAQTAPVVAPPAPEAKPVQAVASPGEAQTLLIDPEMQRRVNELEQRIAQIDNQSREAVGNADRAEGLLVAFAARRALDRGVALGYIEGLLRQRFAQSQRQAVATIITASRDPVTLEELQEGLQDVAPDISGGAPDQSWWSAFRTELNNLITVRKAGTASTMPEERLRRATRRLENGQVDVALAEVLRMPGHEKAEQWIRDASRYVAARRALDAIETAALLEPREPAAGQSARAQTPVRPSPRAAEPLL